MDKQWEALIRFGALNRGGPPDDRNTLTPTPLEIASIDITHRRSLGRMGWLEMGLGYQQVDDVVNNEDSSDVRGFITWRSH